jgi:hypothetical protein
MIIANINYTFSQCDNGNNYYPSSIYEPTMGVWNYATDCNWAGEVIRVNVLNGNTYEFSTCDGYGGVLANYDTQLTLMNESGTVIEFNDDYGGCGLTSYINWTADYTGVVYVHLNEWDCMSNSECTAVMIKRTPSCNTANTTITQTCYEDFSYDIDIVVSALGDAPSVDISDGTNTYFSNVGTGTYQITSFTEPTIINVTSSNDPNCLISESVGSCICNSSSSPSDEPCDAPSVDLSQPFYGSTSCNYTVSNFGGPFEFYNSCNASAQNDSWLTFTAAADSVVLDWEVYNCTNPPTNPDPNSDYFGDPYQGVQFAVFSGDCNNQDDMVLLECNGRAHGTGTFTIDGLSIATDYLIYIDGFYGDQCDYNWTPIGGIAITPPNDTCENATLIACGDLDTSNNILASNIDAPQTCESLTPNVGVWYKYVGNGTDVTITTDNIATNFDTQLFLYSGDCDNLECVDSDDDSGATSGTSQIEFEAEDGTDYYIYVGGDDSSSTPVGQFGLSILCLSCEADAGNWE